MKKLVALLLILSALLTSACAASTLEPIATIAETTETQAKPAKKQPTVVPGVAEPLTLEKVNSFPIASSSMSMDELRQLCVDFMNLQLTWPWQPSKSLSYTGMTGTTVDLSYRTVYGGHPYVSSNQSNLYRIFYYYDQETGILDIEKMGGNYAAIMGNQCSSNSFWAWARVINSIDWNGTSEMTQLHGCIPVAPCTYNGTDLLSFGSQINTEQICESNGQQTMYEAYANLLPADGIVQSVSGVYGHVQMVTRASEVVRKADGTIDGTKSFVYLQDQQTQRTSINQSNNKPIHIQAGVEHKVNFEKLYTQVYLPFTFAEFLGQNPIEVGYAEMDTENVKTAKDLMYATISSNYAISNADIFVYDKDGNMVENIYCFNKNASSLCQYESNLNGMNLLYMKLEKYASADYTLKIDVRIGNGEIHTVFEGSVTKE